MKTAIPSLAVAAALAFAACTDPTNSALDESLIGAFQSVPTGFSTAPTTFAAGGDSAWRPEGRGDKGPMSGPGPMGERSHQGPGGMHGGVLGHFLMGGGLGNPFFGGGFGSKMGHRPYGDALLSGNCAFDAASGRVACEPVTYRGLTITRSAAYGDANGTVQSAFDSLTTNTINTRVSITGAVTRRDSAVTTVQGAGDRTVSGLAPGSTQRTVNGTSAGTEKTVGSNEKGNYTAERVVGDTVQGIRLPVVADTRAYPTAGTVIRSMRVTVTYQGQDPVTSTRREVITYDGSATARIVITQDGQTRNCTLPLPHGRVSCEI